MPYIKLGLDSGKDCCVLILKVTLIFLTIHILEVDWAAGSTFSMYHNIKH